MRRTRRFIVFGCLAIFCGAGMTPPSLPQAPGSDEAQLRELKQVLWPRAYREGDAVLLDRILADEFQMIDAAGAWSTKREELDYVAKHRPTYQSFRFEIRRLEVFPNGTAVVAGRGVVIGQSTEPDGSFDYQSSNILIWRDGRWQAIASHVSGVKTRPAAELAAAD